MQSSHAAQVYRAIGIKAQQIIWQMKFDFEAP